MNVGLLLDFRDTQYLYYPIKVMEMTFSQAYQK